MRFRTIAIAAALLGATSATAAAQTTVVNFEDLSGQAALPATYGGIEWLGGGWHHYDFAQYPYTASSGVQRAYRHSTLNQFGFVAGTATFGGAWFAGSTHVHFQLYLGGELVHTTGVLDLSGTPTFLASGFAGEVDMVEVLTGSGGHWVIDDVTYGVAAATVTPEPGTVLLMATGLVAVGGIARRRRRRSEG